MFTLYKISQQISLTVEQYRLSLLKATKAKVFAKYLYKICFSGICLKINKIEIIDNLILRKDAEILVILQVQLLVCKFMTDQYFEGTVKEFDETGIVVEFMNGLVEGRILPGAMHPKTIYNFRQSTEQNGATQSQKQKQLLNKWILPYSSNKAFTWKLNQKVRFRIQATNWQKQGQTRFADIILLRADQQGLGPVSWWV